MRTGPINYVCVKIGQVRVGLSYEGNVKHVTLVWAPIHFDYVLLQRQQKYVPCEHFNFLSITVLERQSADRRTEGRTDKQKVEAQ